MPKFEKGNTGKPKGSKDHSWAKISHWIQKLESQWELLTPNQKAHYSVELTKLLVSKLKSLPNDPNQSKLNVNEALQLLKQVENTQGIKVEPSDPALP